MWPVVNNLSSEEDLVFCCTQENETLPMIGEKMVKYTTDVTIGG